MCSMWSTSKETSSMRVLPNVHEALRQNDPSRAPGSQPVLKKAPPSAGRPRPKAFYSESEPPRIGTLQPQCSLHRHPSLAHGWSASRCVSSIDSYSHDSRQSTSSSYRCTSKAKCRWRRIKRHTNIHFLNQLNRVRLISRYDTRHFHLINNLQRQRLCHRLLQLISRGRAFQALKVLHHLSCQLQKMCSRCLPVRQQLIQGKASVVAEGTKQHGHPPTSIGHAPSRISLNPISREVQIRLNPSQTYVHFASRSPDCRIAPSIKFIPVTM